MESADQARDPSWSLPRRIAFRFGFLYLIFMFAPSPLEYVPWTEWIVKRWWDAQSAFGAWCAQTLLGAPDELMWHFSGSGDRWIDWGYMVGSLLLAGAGSLVWSILDRARVAYPGLARGLAWYVRWVLAVTMLSYGLAKVLPNQFSFPSPARLSERVGEMSPMGVLWTFMGTSPAYTIFTGAAEVLGALLLMWRRTRLLGALVIIAVMTNVVMLNFCYDVPVKLFSSHLLLLAIVIAAPDARRLANVFVLQRAVDAPAPPPLFASERRRRAAVIAQVMLFALIAWQQGTAELERFHGSRRYPPYHASYDVGAMTRDGVAVPADDPSRWVRLAAGRNGRFMIVTADDVQHDFRARWDADRSTIVLTDRNDEKRIVELTMTVDGEHARFSGTVDGHVVDVRTERHGAFPLETRGFHWVQEAPYNR